MATPPNPQDRKYYERAVSLNDINALIQACNDFADLDLEKRMKLEPDVGHLFRRCFESFHRDSTLSNMVDRQSGQNGRSPIRRALCEAIVACGIPGIEWALAQLDSSEDPQCKTPIAKRGALTAILGAACITAIKAEVLGDTLHDDLVERVYTHLLCLQDDEESNVVPRLAKTYLLEMQAVLKPREAASVGN